MASCTNGCWVAFALVIAVIATVAEGGKLSARYYDKACPSVQNAVRSVMEHRVAGEQRMAPAILRLFFHDCFVNGCDASVLLDATPFSESEKDAVPNASLAGFDVIDEIKSVLEHDCPATVSCSDILALASRDAVALLGGPTWSVPLGRKDSRFASKDDAETSLPGPHDDIDALLAIFSVHGLDARDLTALSGAHTVGMTQSCEHYKDRVYGESADIDPSFAARRRESCQQGGGVAPFDEETPMRFDNAYYRDLIARRGLLTSDQALHSHGGKQDDLVEMYATDGQAFMRDFTKAMVKMGNIQAPLGIPVEVRLNCKIVNH